MYFLVRSNFSTYQFLKRVAGLKKGLKSALTELSI